MANGAEIRAACACWAFVQRSNGFRAKMWFIFFYGRCFVTHFQKMSYNNLHVGAIMVKIGAVKSFAYVEWDWQRQHLCEAKKMNSKIGVRQVNGYRSKKCTREPLIIYFYYTRVKQKPTIERKSLFAYCVHYGLICSAGQFWMRNSMLALYTHFRKLHLIWGLKRTLWVRLMAIVRLLRINYFTICARFVRNKKYFDAAVAKQWLVLRIRMPSSDIH